MQDLPQFLQFQYQNTPNDKNVSVNSKLNGSHDGFSQETGTENNAASKIKGSKQTKNIQMILIQLLKVGQD